MSHRKHSKKLSIFELQYLIKQLKAKGAKEVRGGFASSDLSLV